LEGKRSLRCASATQIDSDSTDVYRYHWWSWFHRYL